MASSQPCATPALNITEISRADGNDLSATFSMRYRKESDPDEDAFYSPVLTTKTQIGVTYPYFDIASVEPGTYVVHTYATASGSSTGTKVTIEVTCGDEVGAS